MYNEPKKLMVVSVGGSPQPIIYSLNAQQPDYVIYFCSRDSRHIVRQEIEPMLQFKPLDHDIIETCDEQNLLVCVKALRDRLPGLMTRWGIAAEAVTGDYTGGTKTMSAALVLVLAGKGCSYSYVGGLERSKQGLGVVIDGREQILYLGNPWDILAVDSLRDIHLLFNRCRFRAVSEIAATTALRVVENRSFFLALEHVAAGFYRWDNFQYRQAKDGLARGMSLLRPFVDGHPATELKTFFAELEVAAARLEKIISEMRQFKTTTTPDEQSSDDTADGQAIILDLLANAVRRAEVEYKYDDAVARLYSVIEKIAKVRLLLTYGLNNSALDIHLVPEEVQTYLQHSCSGDATGRLKVPLFRSYELLGALNDPIGATYQQQQEELEKVLNIRNCSLLAHGFDPVTEKSYQHLLAISLRFVGVEKTALPTFPLLNWSGETLS